MDEVNDSQKKLKKGPVQQPGAAEPKLEIWEAARKKGPDQPPGAPVQYHLQDDDRVEREQGEQDLAF